MKAGDGASERASADFGFERVALDEKQGRVDSVFHSVARRYDIMKAWYEDGMPYAQFVQLDGLHLNDFGQKCIGKLLTRSILNALAAPRG